MKINLTIEARMTSTRLPGKVNLNLNNCSMLEFLIKNVKKSQFIDKIILATTTNASDDILVKCADDLGICHFRGSEANVLKRVVDAHRLGGAEIAVLLTADNPFVSSDLIDEAISNFREDECIYLTNSGTNRKYPDGLDVIVLKRELLEFSLNNAISDADFEHVSNVIFRLKNNSIKNFESCDVTRWYPEASITVDTHADYLKATKIASNLPENYSYVELLSVIKKLGI